MVKIPVQQQQSAARCAILPKVHRQLEGSGGHRAHAMLQTFLPSKSIQSVVMAELCHTGYFPCRLWERRQGPAQLSQLQWGQGVLN